jgi:hypothetical protein
MFLCSVIEVFPEIRKMSEIKATSGKAIPVPGTYCILNLKNLDVLTILP